MDPFVTNTAALVSIAEQLNEINSSLLILKDVLGQKTFFDSQLFAVILGTGLSFSILLLQSTYNRLLNRKRRLFELYKAFADNTWISPSNLLDDARTTSYGYKRIKNGKEEIFPEKELSEKMNIKFRQRVKFQNYPFSYLKMLLKSYNRAILNIHSLKHEEVLTEKAYLKMEKIYKKLIKHCLNKLGETQWTLRDP